MHARRNFFSLFELRTDHSSGTIEHEISISLSLKREIYPTGTQCSLMELYIYGDGHPRGLAVKYKIVAVEVLCLSPVLLLYIKDRSFLVPILDFF